MERANKVVKSKRSSASWRRVIISQKFLKRLQVNFRQARLEGIAGQALIFPHKGCLSAWFFFIKKKEHKRGRKGYLYGKFENIELR
jgi:hypothetical protein